MLQAVHTLDSHAPARSPMNADEILFLIGRPPMGEDIGFLGSRTIDPPDTEALAHDWRNAHQIIGELQAREKGLVDDPSIEELPAELRAMGRRVIDDDKVRRAFAVVPIEIRMIALEQLVVPQKLINLTEVREIRNAIGSDPDPAAIFELCMPLDSPSNIRCIRTTNESFVFVAPSHDLRFLDAFLLDVDQLGDTPIRGMAGGAAAIAVGYSVNCLTALHVQNRLVLSNGTHRALALLQCGITHVPCVVQSITRPDELNLVAPRELQRNPAEFLGMPRPAVLKDFLDPRLYRSAHMARCARQVKVTFSIETIDVPVTGS